MGFGSAGATKSVTGFRIDSRRQYGLASNIWGKYPDQIAAFGRRFEGVIIEQRPAVRVISGHDDSDTLHFVDPPYVHSTRVRPRTGGYCHEMSDDDHVELIDVLKGVEGSVVVCGYPSDLYADLLSDWQMHSTKSRISAASGTKVKIECVWLNKRCVELQKHQRLFA
jgi:DNA adenine methylase